MSGANACTGIKWSSQQIGFKGEEEANLESVGEKFYFDQNNVARGVQSFGHDLTIPRTSRRELGCVDIRKNRQGTPNINATFNKDLDAFPPLYVLATKESTNPTLYGRMFCKSHIAASIFPCDLDCADGTPDFVVLFRDADISSVSYNFTSADDAAFTEDLTMLTYSVIWRDNDLPTSNALENPASNPCAPCSNGYTTEFLTDYEQISFPGQFENLKTVDGDLMAPCEEIDFTENMKFEIDNPGAGLDVNGTLKDYETTVLPQDIPGVACDGTDISNDACIQSITVGFNLNREELPCLGTRRKKRAVIPPVTVTTTIEVTSKDGSGVSALEDGICKGPTCPDDPCSEVGFNSPDRTIRLVTCSGFYLYMGTKNILTNLSATGGDTSGSDVSTTFTYETDDKFTVIHKGEQDLFATPYNYDIVNGPVTYDGNPYSNYHDLKGAIWANREAELTD